MAGCTESEYLVVLYNTLPFNSCCQKQSDLVVRYILYPDYGCVVFPLHIKYMLFL